MGPGVQDGASFTEGASPHARNAFLCWRVGRRAWLPVPPSRMRYAPLPCGKQAGPQGLSRPQGGTEPRPAAWELSLQKQLRLTFLQPRDEWEERVSGDPWREGSGGWPALSLSLRGPVALAQPLPWDWGCPSPALRGS